MYWTSHGIHAEPITFGLNANPYQEFLRKQKVRNINKEISTCAISGALVPLLI